MVVAEVCSSMKYPKRCQYKHAKQKKYHVRNWAEYNEGLRRRGDLTVWFDEEAIANWKADKTGKPGGQRVYSDMAIETGLVVRMVYKLACRQTEGFLHSIASLLGLGIEIPDYSTPVKRWSISSSRTDQNVCCELSRRRQELLVHIGRAARAIGRTLEFDDDGAIDEAVEHRHSERSISQVFGPCIEINVGDEDSPESLNSPRTASVNSGSRSWMRYRLPRRKPFHMSVALLHRSG